MTWGSLSGDLSVLYRAALAGDPDPLAPPAVQYADFAVWEQRRPVQEDDLAYWRARLDPPPPPLDLPADRPRGATRTAVVARPRPPRRTTGTPRGRQGSPIRWRNARVVAESRRWRAAA